MPSLFVILYTRDKGKTWYIYDTCHSREEAEELVEESDTCKIVEYVPKGG